MTTLEVIEPIIKRTYGNGSMPVALAEHLAPKIDEHRGDGLAEMVTAACWNWFPGGTTAAAVADEIVAKLALTSEERR